MVSTKAGVKAVYLVSRMAAAMAAKLEYDSVDGWDETTAASTAATMAESKAVSTAAARAATRAVGSATRRIEKVRRETWR